MNTSARSILASLLVGLAVLVMAPRTAEAQDPGDCARCTSCTDCDISPWGGNSCDYKGDEDCRCRERDGNCNPGFALNVAPGDRRIFQAEQGDLLVVRLVGDTFGAWDCDGALRDAYRETSSGSLVRIGASDFATYANRYGLEAYISVLTERILAGGG